MRQTMINALKVFMADEDGPTAVEYAIITALLAAGVVASVLLLAEATQRSFRDSGSAIN